MKLVRYLSSSGDLSVGYLDGDTVVPVVRPDGPGDEAILSVAMGESPAQAIGEPEALTSVRLLMPIARPPALRDFITFEQHYSVMLTQRGEQVPEEWYRTPVFYFSTIHRLMGPDDEVIPPDTDELDFELEVAAVVGREVSNVSPEEATQAIAGYTLFNDWSARDIQRREMALLLGPSKSKDFGNAFGPVLATPDEFDGEPGRPRTQLRACVNGREYSRDRLEHMHYTFGQLIAHAARDSRVRAGDLLGSGTAATGCIHELSKTHGEEQYPWLSPGDVVELEAEGIGVLRNVVGRRD